MYISHVSPTPLKAVTLARGTKCWELKNTGRNFGSSHNRVLGSEPTQAFVIFLCRIVSKSWHLAGSGLVQHSNFSKLLFKVTEWILVSLQCLLLGLGELVAYTAVQDFVWSSFTVPKFLNYTQHLISADYSFYLFIFWTVLVFNFCVNLHSLSFMNLANVLLGCRH